MIALSTAQWKIVGYCFAGLVLIAVVLLTFDKCGTYWGNRGLDKARANVNAALQAANKGKEVVANDRIDEAVALDRVKQAANDVVSASNATDEAKQAANQAVANYVAAKQANVPTGTTESDLNEKLRALGN